MAAPTLIATSQIDSPWAQTANIVSPNATKAYPSSLTTLAGDLIVALQGAADATNNGTLSCSGSLNGAYTNRANAQNASHCSVQIASVASGAGTETVTLTRSVTSSNSEVGGAAFQFRNHGGIGNVFTATDNVQTGNLTCSANSAILVLILDWNAVSGAQTWATINGASPTSTGGVTGDGSTWAVAWAYFADVGAAGSKTITLSTPNFGAETFAAIEIKGSADAADTVRKTQRPGQKGPDRRRFFSKQYDLTPYSYPNLFTTEGTAAVRTPGPHRGPPGRQFQARRYAFTDDASGGTIASGAGSITAAATVIGVGASTNAANASATSVTIPIGVGASSVSAAFSAAAVGNALGTGASTASADILSQAVATAIGVGVSAVSGAGSISALATVVGVGASTAAADINATSTTVVIGVGAATAAGDFSAAAAGNAFGDAGGVVVVSAAGSIAAVVTVTGVGASSAGAAFSAQGVGDAQGAGASSAGAAFSSQAVATVIGVAGATATIASGAGSITIAGNGYGASPTGSEQNLGGSGIAKKRTKPVDLEIDEEDAFLLEQLLVAALAAKGLLH